MYNCVRSVLVGLSASAAQASSFTTTTFSYLKDTVVVYLL